MISIEKAQFARFLNAFLTDNFLNNKTKQRPKISILSRLVYNPKKQDTNLDKMLIFEQQKNLLF